MTIEFDEELRARLLAFQQQHGLANDGWAGAETWRKLVEIGYAAAGGPQAVLATAAVGMPAKHPNAPDVLTVETIPITAAKPAPAEGKSRNTTAADRAKLEAKRNRWNPEQPKERFQADHVKPHSQTPPGSSQKLRNRDAHANMSEGGGKTRHENSVRRQQPDWQDPKSPNYTRPVEKGKPKGSGKPGAKASATPAANPPGKPAGAAPSEPAIKAPEVSGGKAPGGAGVKPADVPIAKPSGKPAVKPAGEPTIKPSGEPAVKPSAGAGMKGAGSKVLGAAGEALMARSLATDLEWRDSMQDPKWGKVHVDAMGQTWHRSTTDPGEWFRTDGEPPPDA